MRKLSQISIFLTTLVVVTACDNSISSKFREPQSTKLLEDKEDRLEFGCTIQVFSTEVDGTRISRMDEEDGSIDEEMEILPVVDEKKVITMKLKPFGKFTGTQVEAPPFVTLAQAGSDDEGNLILNFSSDESFIYVGKVVDKRGKVSQCSIGVTIIPEPEEEEE